MLGKREGERAEIIASISWDFTITKQNAEITEIKAIDLVYFVPYHL